MANEVALTDIRYGTEDGEVIFIAAGQPVKDIPAENVKTLREQRAIGAPAAPSENAEETAVIEGLRNDKEALEDEVIKLREQLAEATKPPATAKPAVK